MDNSIGTQSAPTLVLILDIDGVIRIENLVDLLSSSRPDVVNCYVSIGDESIRKEQFSYDPAVVHFINELARDFGVEVLLLSEWKSDSVALAQIGLDGFDFIDEPPLDYQITSWWKIDALRELRQGRLRDSTVVWVDNDIRNEPDALEWAQRLGITPISPLSIRGITDSNMNQIAAALHLAV